ncbi:MAG TPA: tetratricopeptide repeat protein [Gemmataceae bacterium]|nr:tetratricopeptide repeat protein [Gemmataceae bacterium]
MATIAEKLALAAQCHQSGALGQAEQICREVLQSDPGHAEALHRLGVLAFQMSDYTAAISHIRAALAANPTNGGYFSNLALVYQALHQWDDAVASLRESIRLAPDLAAAHFNLGNILKQQGKLDEAAASYRQALLLQPDFAPAHHNLANILSDQDRLEEAVSHYQQVVRINPRHALAHNNFGNTLKKQSKLDEATKHFRQAALLQPDFDQPRNNLGSVFCEQGKFDEALVCFQEALRCNPQCAEAYLNLGTLFRIQGKTQQAINAYHETLRLKPNCVDAYKRLGDLWQDQGRFDEAIACYRLALSGDPDCFTTQNNLGNVLRKQGKWAGAASCYHEALRLSPDCAVAHYNLGGLFADQIKLEEAAASYREAVRLDPDLADAHSALGAVLNDQGKMEEAIASWQKATRLDPNDRLRIAMATRLPIIYQSMGEIEFWRERLIREVGLLREQKVALDITEQPILTLFYLAYQGLNDRDIHRDLGRLFRAPRQERDAAGSGRMRSRPGDKIRIGMLSCYFTTHTIGLLNRGLVAQLSRDDFEVTVLSIGNHDNEAASFFKQHADHYLEVSRHFPTARRLIAEQNLDILYFADIDMDPLASTLAHSRLAPVQCATWGHPVTTGLDTMDYFISSADLETDEAHLHYTEALVCPKTLPIYYYRPQLPGAPKDRSEFGWSNQAHIYACPQSLFKLHPEFDEVLATILRRDPHGELVLLEGKYQFWDELLRRRLTNTIPDVMDRVRFVPFLNRPDFVNLMAVADVLLDPLHFVGGNTSYEALAFGSPIVTLPSKFLRGRITYALYKQMGVMDCVAQNTQEYVEIALRLGNDHEYRDMMRRKILDASDVLYENSAGIRELEKFFRQAVQKHSAG